MILTWLINCTVSGKKFYGIGPRFPIPVVLHTSSSGDDTVVMINSYFVRKG